ncbi:hypothetical protein L2E82_17499 [Cichorium intybus]|uniref:Uncharacterized protein n=1 Tax=Cichorium intybus TaxID=13427 RepID=A0ACB9F8F9_CICIN|nr:hypothetical protein L2E82_17499 [Cichorium intybus]
MGRKKLEIKRIEDKSSRLVAFSKRRTGLISKAQQLSVLCDVDVALMVFSASGKLYEFCSGGTNSMKHLLARYEAEDRAIKGHGDDLIASAKDMYAAGDDGGGGLNDIIINHIDSPQHETLPLFST